MSEEWENQINHLRQKVLLAKKASKALSVAATDGKNLFLQNLSTLLQENCQDILAANYLDMQNARSNGMSEAMQDRLLLNQQRILTMAEEVRKVAQLPDPIGEIIEGKTLPNGLQLYKKRVPLGVIATIYESRPNVTIDISALCIKAGNAVVLRGGKEAFHSNTILSRLISQAAQNAGLPADSAVFIDNTNRELVTSLLQMNDLIDLIIPRGNSTLINLVKSQSTIPVVAGGIGVCHTYIDDEAELEMSTRIAYNAKVQRPTVCNALDCLIIHKAVLSSHLTSIAQVWDKAGVIIRADQEAFDTLSKIAYPKLEKVAPEDYGTEFLSLVAAVKTVSSITEALDHIDRYGSGHSEAIVTNNYQNAQLFTDSVDAATVYVNASTRFTDGAQFGLGAEIGISTQKMHARGPLGLKEITSYKWIVMGQGQTRP